MHFIGYRKLKKSCTLNNSNTELECLTKEKAAAEAQLEEERADRKATEDELKRLRNRMVSSSTSSIVMISLASFGRHNGIASNDSLPQSLPNDFIEW